MTRTSSSHDRCLPSVPGLPRSHGTEREGACLPSRAPTVVALRALRSAGIPLRRSLCVAVSSLLSPLSLLSLSRLPNAPHLNQPIHPSTHPRTTNPLPPHPLAVQFVWDDRAAVLMNSDVRPETPLSHLLVHDFWGQPINTAGSHKSYRPLCVLSFRASFLHARLTDVVPDEYRRHREERATEGGGATATPPLPVDLPPGPYAFHFGNVAIHAVASAMVVLVAMGGPVVSLQWSPFEAGVAGLVFAVHPVRGKGGEGEETEQEKEQEKERRREETELNPPPYKV